MANITKIYLLNVPVESDYKITLYFPDSTAQYNYFISKRVKSYENCSYQRKEGIIRFNENIDNLYNCNYVMYQNNNGKWFYAFIKDMEYKGDDQTNITIETDVMQTWMFDYTIKSAFIEREHTDDDNEANHTIPEGLETGEYITSAYYTDEALKQCVYVLMVTEYKDAEGSWKKVKFQNFGRIPQGYTCLIFTTPENMSAELKIYDDAGKGDAVIGAYMIPPAILQWNASDGKYLKNQLGPGGYAFKIPRPTSLNGYTPKNNKLFCSPYIYLVVSNNAGSSNTLLLERFFEEPEINFEIKGVPTMGGSIKCVPYKYNGIEFNEEEGIMAGKFPTLSWSSDLYTNWLTQNAVNIGVGVVSSLGSVIAGAGAMVATAGTGAVIGGGMIASGVSGIASQIGQIYQHSLTPNSARGNTNGGDINTASSTNTFHFTYKCITREYAEIIDNYFTRYGYKVNKFGKPLKAHRRRFWFTKTTEIDINAPIPNNDIQKIKDCYNSGITFWRATDSNIGDYTNDNTIIVD